MQSIALILAILSFAFSVVSFIYVNHDRRVRLVPRPRKGKWCVLYPTLDRKETILRGIIEVYNRSSRPNTIMAYRFYTDNNGVHEEFESERYSNTEHDEMTPGEETDQENSNITPLTIAPYSGVEVPIQAIIKGAHSLVLGYLPVTVEIEDVFGNRYSTQISAEQENLAYTQVGPRPVLGSQ